MPPQKAEEKMKLVKAFDLNPAASIGDVSIGNGPQAECTGVTNVTTNITEGKRTAKNVMIR